MKKISDVIFDKSIKTTPFIKSAADGCGGKLTLSEQMAYLTHFIQNQSIIDKLNYSQKALEIIDEVSAYLTSQGTGSIVTEEPPIDYSYSLFTDVKKPTFS